MDQRLFRVRRNGMYFEVVEHLIYDNGRDVLVDVLSRHTERYLADKEVERLTQQQEGGG